MQQNDTHDKAVEGSFPASDPPSSSGITGPKTDRSTPPQRRQPSERGADTRPAGTPTDHRHATETAGQWDDGGERHDR